MNMHCIPILLALAPFGRGTTETLAFKPEEGSSLEKVWVTKHTLIVSDMNRSKGDAEAQVRMKSNVIGSEETIGVVDEYMSVGEERPLRFRRSFHKGKRTSQLASQNENGETTPTGASIRQKLELRGTSIVFTWVPEEGEYGKYYDKRLIDEEALEYLRSDMDLAFLLPAGPVEVGDSWKLPAESMIDLFGRGGTLPFAEAPKKDDFLIRAMDSGVAGGMDQAFGGEAEGSVDVVFREVREADGRRIGVLGVKCDVRYERDRTEFVQANTIRMERREGIEYLDAYLTLGVKGNAEILWDLDRNLPLELAFTGDETVFARITHRAPMDEEGINRSQNVTLEGALVIRATFTPRS